MLFLKAKIEEQGKNVNNKGASYPSLFSLLILHPHQSPDALFIILSIYSPAQANLYKKVLIF